MILSHQLYRTKQLLLTLCIWETLARSAIYTDFLFLLCKNETKVKTKHFYIVGCEFWRLGSWKDIYFLSFDFFIKQSWLGCEKHQGSKVITQCAPLVLTYSIIYNRSFNIPTEKHLGYTPMKFQGIITFQSRDMRSGWTILWAILTSHRVTWPTYVPICVLRNT